MDINVQFFLIYILEVLSFCVSGTCAMILPSVHVCIHRALPSGTVLCKNTGRKWFSGVGRYNTKSLSLVIPYVECLKYYYYGCLKIIRGSIKFLIYLSLLHLVTIASAWHAWDDICHFWIHKHNFGEIGKKGLRNTMDLIYLFTSFHIDSTKIIPYLCLN